MDRWLSRFGFDRVSSTWWAKKDRGVLVRVVVVPIGVQVSWLGMIPIIRTLVYGS